MKITIKYFGLLAEISNCNEEQIDFEGTSIADLKKVLFQKHEGLQNNDFQIAQNNELTTNETRLVAPEVALLPPFAGG